ncbi:MAG: hypothetical protein QXY62_03990 [Candidatus Altiarchaeota archaeon]
MEKSIVVKIGGSSLSKPGKIKHLAKTIAITAKKGKKIVTVVSAIGKTTDELISFANQVSKEICEEELDGIVSMGERISARLFCSALRAENLKAKFIDVDNENWPLITDEKHGNANVLLPESKTFIKSTIENLLRDNSVVVVPGFIGRTKEGKITTLGRGGSDTTAFVIADAIDAEQVILISDSCLKSGDIKIIKNPKEIPEIEIEDLLCFADSGTKFIHKKSLLYKPKGIDVRIINNRSKNLLEKGTLIKGSLRELYVEDNGRELAMLTISGRHLIQNKELLINLFELIEKQKIRVIGLNANSNSLELYVDGVTKKQINQVHDLAINSENVLGLAVRRNLCLLKIKGIALETTEGILAKITNALREEHLNIFGVFTITNSILIFLDSRNADKAKELLEKKLGTTQK